MFIVKDIVYEGGFDEAVEDVDGVGLLPLAPEQLYWLLKVIPCSIAVSVESWEQ